MQFKIMDRTGHSTEVYDKADTVSTEQAMARFAKLMEGDKAEKKEPMTPFRADGDGKHTRLKAFDPDAETVLWVPQLVGG